MGEHRIWVDASFRNGITVVAAVHEKRGLLECRFEEGITKNTEAEAVAVRLGKDLAVEQGFLPAVILCDCLSVAEGRYGHITGKKVDGVRVAWSSRRENRAHDAALNLLRTRISHRDPSSVPQIPKRERAKPVQKQKPNGPLPYLPVPESQREDWKAALNRFWQGLGS